MNSPSANHMTGTQYIPPCGRSEHQSTVPKRKKKLSCLQVKNFCGRKPQQGNGNSKKCDARDQEKLLFVVSSYLFHSDSDAADRAVATLPREWRPRGPTPGGRKQSLPTISGGSFEGQLGRWWWWVPRGTPEIAPSR